ncbi:hypothetical protein DAEQUDRAFT_732100 [Daedalea quercina L-15889]|uniref:Uncharacterized protein n=1 Tax=Daedalea quercina L-15889 TaxID=1314783 RepID=A0A165LV63_9APHY|nr:hypothetical protein DAEQUDRAFT_732100 [Daedalea quercina L-15889]
MRFASFFSLALAAATASLAVAHPIYDSMLTYVPCIPLHVYTVLTFNFCMVHRSS